MRALRGVLVVVFAALASGCGDPSPPSKGEDPKLIYDRVWVDQIPEKHTDYMHAFLVLKGRPIGIFQKSSSYDMHLELFEHKREANKMRVFFPQSKKQHEMKYQITACDDVPPFDLCLEVSKNPWGGPKKYRGLREEDAENTLLGGVKHRMMDETR